MGAAITLCVEEEACRNPVIIGLEGEALDAQPWLDVYTTGEETRCKVFENSNARELWVLSCDDVEPINLAASVKADRPDVSVCLVERGLCGSLLSRAHTAGIDEVVQYDEFSRRYAQGKSHGARQGVEGGAPALKAKGKEEAPPIELVVENDLPSPIARFLKFKPNMALAETGNDNRAFVLTVVSGSGGAGKSAVSALGALVASNWGYKTLLLDCDLQFGDVAAMVGVQDPLCIDEVLARPERIEAELLHAASPSVLAAPLRLEVSEEVVRQLPALIEQVSCVFDVVVVNTGASWAEQHAVLLERSSVALFLIDQRVSSVRACRHALELCARCGIAATPFQYALNRCAKGAPLSLMDVSSALQGVPVFELKEGGRDVEDYLSAGAASELIEVKNDFARSVERVMERLLPSGIRVLPESPSASDGRQGLLRRGRHLSGKRGRRQQ